ncbi:CPBP family intramembrane glutamic endopeptidase, partial [Streptomyces sp. MCAF7]
MRIPTEVIQLTQFGPALGVVAVALLWPSPVWALLAGAWPAERPGRARRALPLLAMAPLITALSAGTYALATGDAHATDPRSLDHPFALIVVAQLIGACAEEIGWRCFLQPLLRTRFGPLTASTAIGAVWGVWHVQMFAQAPAYAAGFLLGTVAMSVVLG